MKLDILFKIFKTQHASALNELIFIRDYGVWKIQFLRAQ